MKKILITGANGLLGRKLVAILSQQKDLSLVATAKGVCRFFLPSKIVYRSLDITNADVCKNLINSYDPDEESIKDEYEKLKKMISLAK